jgi:hypothetical protein
MAASNQSDQVNLLQALATSSGSHSFIVRTTMATMGASTETYGFANVPVGAYGVRAVRTTLNADGSTTATASAVQSATVSIGATVTVNLGL